MEAVTFFLAAIISLAGACGVVFLRNPVHAALSLVATLFGVAIHFINLEAYFVAAVQVIVYAGAIVILFLFVIMLLGVDRAESIKTRSNYRTETNSHTRSWRNPCVRGTYRRRILR